MSEVNTFKSREAFLSFLESVSDNPYDNVPVLRGYITRLYYHNDMPVLNKVDLIDSCCRNCAVISEVDTAMYIDKLVQINFLIVTQKHPTKILSVTDMAFENLYLNTEFYNPDRFAMGTPGVAHAGEDESFSMSKNAKQAFDHALATGGNIVGDTLSVMISEAVENKEVKPSTGQTWTHKQKGYDVEITYINRRGGGIRVEEVATGQPDGFGIEVFLERFSPKNKDSSS